MTEEETPQRKLDFTKAVHDVMKECAGKNGPELEANAAAAVSAMLGRAADAIVADAASRAAIGEGGAETATVLSKREMHTTVGCCLGAVLAEHACHEGNKAVAKARKYLACKSDLLSMSKSSVGLHFPIESVSEYLDFYKYKSCPVAEL